MLGLIIVLLFFGLLIGIFVRLGKSKDIKTGVVCPLCRSNIDPRATVCPHCSRNIDRAAVIQQLKRSQTRAYIVAGLVIAVIVGVAGYNRVTNERGITAISSQR